LLSSIKREASSHFLLMSVQRLTSFSSRALSPVFFWASAESFQKSGSEVSSFSFSIWVRMLERSKMAPELGEFLPDQFERLLQFNEHGFFSF